MKRKLRIFSHIAIICLSICMFAFGVYAASTVSVTTSGTVTFSATGVYATVSRTISGSSADASHNALAPVEITADVQDEADPFTMDADLVFASANTPIIMSFTVKNEATDRDLYFKVTEDTTKATLQENDNVRKLSWDLGHWVALAPEDSYTVNINLSVVDPNVSVKNCVYAYAFELKNSLSADGYYTLTKDDVTFSEGKITKFNLTVSAKEKIVIPSSINGVEVTQLGSGSAAISDSTLSVAEIIIPSSVQTIANDVFGSGSSAVITNLTKLFAPSVTVVEKLDFDSSYNFEEVYLPKAQSAVLDYLPYTTKKLILPNATTFTSEDMWGQSSFPTSMEYIVIPNITSIGDKIQGGLGGGTYLKYVDISSVTEIPNYCFQSCSSIEVILLSPNITFIGAEAFYGCATIPFTKLPENLVSIGNSAFDHLDASQLSFLTEIPQSVKNIGEYAFSRWQGSSITIYNTIETIEQYAFGYQTTVNFIGTEAEWNAKVSSGKISGGAFESGTKVFCTDSNGDPIVIS